MQAEEEKVVQCKTTKVLLSYLLTHMILTFIVGNQSYGKTRVLIISREILPCGNIQEARFQQKSVPQVLELLLETQ